MTTTTSDPLVVMLYGLLAYPSQRPAVTTTADLVVGQSGPWALENDDQAELAGVLVARLRGTPSGGPLGEAIASTVLEAVRSCRVMVSEFWSDAGSTMPPHMVQEVEQLEDRLLRFTAALENWSTSPAPAPAGADAAPADHPGAVLPPVEVAARYRTDEWVVLIRRCGLDPTAVFAELREAAASADRVPPRSLREVYDRPDLAGLLLDIIAARSQAVAW